MANSTWRALTNDTLRLSVLQTIASDSIFDDDTQLQEFQYAAKYRVRLAHNFLTLRAVKHFATRRIPFPITSGQHTYPLDVGINPSAIKIRTFFNVTSSGSQNQEIFPMEYSEFLRRYPDPSLVPTGAPTHWVFLPIERTDLSPVHKVRIVPTPDASYTLEFRAQILPYALALSTDIVLWPPEYEHVLTMWSWAATERALGEGKEGIIEQQARQAANEVQLIAGRPDDVRKAIRTMAPINGVGWPPGRYTGWVSSPLG